jgi:CHAD domain-containing protein
MQTESTRASPASDKIKTIRREPIALDPSMTAGEAFAAVTDGCIAHITDAAASARRSDSPEGIHQLRVGIRRLRAAFSVFGPALPSHRPRIAAQLRSLQDQLGAARELDVLLEETIASMPKKRRKRRGMRELRKIVQAERAVRHRRTRSSLASRRCAEFLSRLEPAIDRYVNRPDDDNPRKTERVTVFAADVLRARRRKARKLGKKIGDLGPQKLHKLRIRIKKLRYAAEFFSSVARRGRSKRYLRALKDLQQRLGTSHDAIVASSLIDQMKGEAAGDGKRAAKLAEDWANKCFKRVRRKLPGAWRRFDKRKQPLKRGKKPRRLAQGGEHEVTRRFVAPGSAAL